VALALLLRRMLITSGIPSDRPYRIEHARPAEPAKGRIGRALSKLRRARGPVHGQTTINAIGVADLIAANDLLANWPHWMKRRAEVQTRRRRADRDIFELFLRPLWYIEDDPAFRTLLDGSAEFFKVREMFEGLTLISKDPER